MKRGGKRKGAGNKEGSTRPNFYAFVTPKDIKDYMLWVKANFKTNDKLAVWYGDHLFGKAQQPISGPEGGPIEITLIKYANGDTTPSPVSTS